MTPEPRLEPRRLRSGLGLLALDHVFSQCMAALTSGVFMVGLVLALGGSNQTIGLIAAIGPVAQAVQLPSIFLVERLRRRRAITVLGAWAGRATFLLIAAAPWVVPASWQVPTLLAAILVHCVFGAVSGCSYASWIRDVIPNRLMGRYMGKRLAWAIGVSAVLSLGAGFALGPAQHWLGPVAPFSLIFALAGVLGIAGTAQLLRVPEPAMARTAGKTSALALLRRPLADRPFRRVLSFMGWWAFAQNFAAPFFVVYMLQRLELSLGAVVALTVLTQLVNVALFPLWGRFADRFSTKAVMGASGWLFIVSFLFWPLMTMEGRWWGTWPLLVGAHLLMGVATAGVAIASRTLALKAAPRGEATAYLATNALVTGVGAALSPLMAGPLGDFFSERTLTLTFSLVGPDFDGPVDVPALNLQGLDFLFVLAFVFGLFALHRLSLVRERGEVGETVVLRELQASLRRGVFSVAGPVGVRQALTMPVLIKRPRRAGNRNRARPRRGVRGLTGGAPGS